ncbi:MAG: transcriptional repressor NrdR [Armatimonadetes bacterium]|nr:transcriptional repressor NrdR [Armatimonadota bacterium]
MNCPYCCHPEQKVLDSRPCRDGHAIRRRRECDHCHRRFTTFEEIERARLFLVKRDGSREEFSREKLLSGMFLACRKRPVPHARIVDVSVMIEQELLDEGDLEVPSARVGKMVLNHLSEIDEVAYIRFASVYEKFETPAEFSRFVDVIRKKSNV